MKAHHCVTDFRGAARLPAVVGPCVFQAGPSLSMAGEQKGIRTLGFATGERLYESQHSTLMQQLIVGLKDGSQICLEMELIIGWSGQGGYPTEPWQKLVDFGKLLSRAYAIPLRQLPGWPRSCAGAPEGAW